MGDRTNAEIEIGGTLPRCCAEVLLDVLREEGIGPDYWVPLADVAALENHLLGQAEFAAQAKVPPSAPVFGGSDISGGNLDAAEAFCRRQGLPYRQHWDAGGEWSAGNRYWFPGDAAPQDVCATDDGTDMVGLHELRSDEWKDKTVADVLAHYATIVRPIPLLELAPAPAGGCPHCEDDAEVA